MVEMFRDGGILMQEVAQWFRAVVPVLCREMVRFVNGDLEFNRISASV